MRITAIVPARNEAATVGHVVRAARASPLVDDVIVVDGASTDGTGQRAAAAGARVIHPDGPGKGAAMLAGLRATDAEVLVFLDGDLTGLGPHHVDRLARTVAIGDAVMACGLFDRGPMINTVFLHALPILTGERAVRRELLEALTADDVAGYRVEAALNCRAGDVGGPIAAFVCGGMFHNTKEEKFHDPVRGSIAKAGMIATAYSSFLRYRLRYGWGAAGTSHRLAPRRLSPWRLTAGRGRRAQPPAPTRPGTRPAHEPSTTSPLASVVDHVGDSDGAHTRTPPRSSSQRSRG